MLAYDEETGEQAYKLVTRLFRNTTEAWYHVRVDGEEIVCTGGHPFYILNAEVSRKSVLYEGIKTDKKGKWITTKELKVSDQVLLSDGSCAIIETIEVENLSAPETTYNFEIADFHTYYVSNSKVLVHNKCNIDKEFDTFEEAERYFKDELGEGAEVCGKTAYGENVYRSADGLKVGYLDKSHHPYRPKGMKFSPDHFNIQIKNSAGKVIKDIHIFWGLK